MNRSALLVDAASFSDSRSGVARRALEIWPRVAVSRPHSRLSIIVRAAMAPTFRSLIPGAEVIVAPTDAATPWARWRRHSPWIRRWATTQDVRAIVQDTLPPAWPERSWLTVHDLRALDAAGPRSWLRLAWARWILPGVLGRVPRVIVPSEWVARDVTRRLGVPAERLRVVPNGVDARRFRAGSGDRSILERHGLTPGGYILTVGHREPRKGIVEFVRWAARRQARRLGERFVVVGRQVPGLDAPEREARRLGVTDRVLFLGDAADAEIDALYGGAAVYVTPSRLEGFGMTVLEAMAAGVPVIAPKHGPFPEVAGRRALIDNVDDIEAWDREFDRLSSDAAYRAAAIAEGDACVARQSWDVAAAAMCRIIDEGA